MCCLVVIHNDCDTHIQGKLAQTLASQPCTRPCATREKVAWYRLFAHARNVPYIFRKIVQLY